MMMLGLRAEALQTVTQAKLYQTHSRDDGLSIFYNALRLGHVPLLLLHLVILNGALQSETKYVVRKNANNVFISISRLLAAVVVDKGNRKS
jgi:hypothetical protein